MRSFSFFPALLLAVSVSAQSSFFGDADSFKEGQEKLAVYIQLRDLHGSFLYLGTFVLFPLGFFVNKV